MQRIVWIIAAMALALWSLLAWLGNAMLGWLADFVAANAGQLTMAGELAGWLSWSAALADAAGGALIVVVWLLGSVAIAIVAFFISRLAGRHAPPQKPGYYKILPPGRRF